MPIILIKIIFSLIVVLGLLLISEKNPKLGGLLAGLPVGALIMTLFFGIEQGNDFVLAGIPYAIAGLTSSLLFGAGFYLGGKLFKQYKILNIISSFSLAFIIFFASGFLIEQIKISLVISLLIFLAGKLFSLYFFKHIEQVSKVEGADKLNLKTLTFRVSFILFTVLLITGIAEIIGAKWSGIMASFPTGLTPLLLVLAYLHQEKIYPVVLKNLSYSVSTLVVYYLSILHFIPILGLYYGIIIAYLNCLAYLFLLNRFILRKI